MNDEKKLSALGVVVPDNDGRALANREALKQLEPSIKSHIKSVLEDLEQVRNVYAAEARNIDCMGVVCISDEQNAIEVIGSVGKSLKHLDEARMKSTVLWRGVVTLFNDRYSVLIEPLRKSRDELKKRCANWRLTEDLRIRAENKKRQAEEQRLRGEELQKIKTDPRKLDEPIPVIKREAPTQKMTGGHMRDNWKAEEVDFDLVPRAYLCTDWKKVNAHKTEHHDTKPIPGIRIWNEPTVVAR